MAYARLDVFWPDGRFESFLLETDTVSVGRAPGNTIALDTEMISRYHFSITRDDDKVVITDLDSANGTLVDGSRLKSNEPRQLDGVEEIQIGNLRIIFQTVDDSPTIPIVPNNDETQESPVEVDDYEVHLDKMAMSVWPSSSNSVEISLTNYHEEPQLFAVSVDGLPKEWVRINHPRLEIAPNDTRYILFNVRPARRIETAPGNYPVSITVSPKNEDLTPKTIEINVKVEPYSGFGVALTTPNLEMGDEFKMFLHNQGTLPLDIDIVGESPQSALSFNIPASPIQLTAGKRVQVRGTITPNNRPVIGSEQTHTFRLKAQARNSSRFLTVVEGKMSVAPMLPTWAAITAGGVALSALVIFFVLVGGLLFETPEPEIVSIAVNNTQIAKGSPLILRWNAENAESYTIHINSTPIPDVIGGNRANYEIGTGDLSGDVEVALYAINGESTAVATQMVRVYQPLRLGSFTVQPTDLTRYFVSTLSLSWNIPGAVLVRIEGMEQFSNAPIQEMYDSQGALESVSGIADQPFTITLYAEDEAGNSITETVDIIISELLCTIEEEIALREGPDFAHQVVSQVDEETIVVINAQDETGNWLRTTLTGDIDVWAPRDAFSCPENLNLAELQKAIDVPVLPTATLMPSPTAIPTQTLAPPDTEVPTTPPTETEDS